MLGLDTSAKTRGNLARWCAAAALWSLVSVANAAKPAEVLESALGECEFKGRVEGESGYGKNWGWQPIAKAYALQRAEKLGATHVVWQRFIPVGAFNGVAVARAYHCG